MALREFLLAGKWLHARVLHGWLPGGSPGCQHAAVATWGPATCGLCSAPIGVAHPLFTTRRDTRYAWITFSGCRLCGALRCGACADATCDVCGEPPVADTFPAVWLNTSRSMLWCRDWCVASEGRPLHAQQPGAPWWSCPECASGLCDPCARERKERCHCLARVVLGGVPPARAYLPPRFRELLRDPSLSVEAKRAALRAEIARIEADWARGIISRMERDQVALYDAALFELD